MKVTIRGFDSVAGRARKSGQDAFNLLEVMVAVAIFFVAAFSILQLTSTSLRSARALTQPQIDASSLAAWASLTNRLEEGVESGDFGEAYPNYVWESNTYQVSTNGLFQVDFTVGGLTGTKRVVVSKMSILLYRPQSRQPGTGGIRR